MAVEVFINFDGNCREAVTFYAEVFGLEVPKMMTFGDAPPSPDHPVDETTRNLVMYACMPIMGSNTMFSDCFPGSPFVAGNNITVTISSSDVEELKTYFNRMKKAGKVGMELQETFWSKCYGSIVDQFGIHWQFSHDSGDMNLI